MNTDEAIEALHSPLFRMAIMHVGKLTEIDELSNHENHLIFDFKHKVEMRCFYEALMLVYHDAPSSFDYQYYKSLKNNPLIQNNED